jgi:hypothetical protein
MYFNKTKFGKIWVDGEKYTHDIYFFPDGTLKKRDKSHSPRIGGHRSLSKWELEKILASDPEIIIIGMGQSGILPFTESTEKLLAFIGNEGNIEIIKGTTPNILDQANQVLKSGKKVAGIIHTTC